MNLDHEFYRKWIPLISYNKRSKDSNNENLQFYKPYMKCDIAMSVSNETSEVNKQTFKLYFKLYSLCDFFKVPF